MCYNVNTFGHVMYSFLINSREGLIMTKEVKSKARPTPEDKMAKIDEMRVFVEEMMHYIQRISEVLDRIEKKVSGGF